jgi:hypothetical protein
VLLLAQHKRWLGKERGPGNTLHPWSTAASLSLGEELGCCYGH